MTDRSMRREALIGLGIMDGRDTENLVMYQHKSLRTSVDYQSSAI